MIGQTFSSYTKAIENMEANIINNPAKFQLYSTLQCIASDFLNMFSQI